MSKKLSPELLEAIKRSREDVKAGRVRKYKDIARECGLRGGNE